MISKTNKDFNVIAYGSTGFTGRIVADYINQNYKDSSLKWAVAGRSESKLISVKEKFDISVPHIVADVNDEESIDEMVKKGDVIISTVGPYSLYGSKLVEKCAETGTHLVDLTGESFWVKEMIDKYHLKAIESGEKIVFSCGFDSIPSDIGTLMLADYIMKKYQTKLVEVTCYSAEIKDGGFSGGTVASMFAIAESKGLMSKGLSDPYLLVREDQKPTYPNPSNSGGWFHYDSKLPGYIVPCVFASHDTKVVHRSNSYLNYGPLTYYEYFPFMLNRISGFFAAFVYTVIYYGLGISLAIGPLRNILKMVLPKPGQGPSKSARENSYFKMHLIGKGENGVVVRGLVGSNEGDAGYNETSKMIAESALALALDYDKLPKFCGILTPAVALGLPLVERLRNKKMFLEVSTLKE